MKKLTLLTTLGLTALAASSFALAPAAQAKALEQQYTTLNLVLGGMHANDKGAFTYGINADWNYRLMNGWYAGVEGQFTHGTKKVEGVTTRIPQLNFGLQTKYLFETASDWTPYVGAAIGYQYQWENYKTLTSNLTKSKHTGGVYGQLAAGTLYGEHLNFGVKAQVGSVSKNFASKSSRASYIYSIYAGYKF